ncbi:alpha-L-glutamate ligase [Sphingomonas sp. BN140010]|uniref:Alpha-L-glutamate ligase n=1 Tax=Sphingomonas arvum TaxID=2992113 RepID=A0ABT3JEH2_9SPHN|nr:alpha-L-glutamate ligase [Sphingomonas sp. BN140010]MCW3797414.1 alpha-L-glutamate ligase [Sphingomonas sp. BN140010]
MTADLAILYEHPRWFAPLFAALDRRGIRYQAIDWTDHRFDLAAPPPARLILNRLAMSAFLRAAEHPIFYAAAALDHWQRQGARVLNGAGVLALDSNKARQLSLFRSLGLGIPDTRVVHRAADLPSAAEGMRFPLLVKANIGGAGAGIVRFDDLAALQGAVRQGNVPASIDNVLMLQDYVPARGGTILRLETLAGRFLYALEVATGAAFDLCPADACLAEPGRAAIAMRAVDPGPELVEAAERIAAAAGLDVGGVEVVIDDRDGTPRFYDFNALSNFVAKPSEVLGWDPHDRLVDYLEQELERVRA